MVPRMTAVIDIPDMKRRTLKVAEKRSKSAMETLLDYERLGGPSHLLLHIFVVERVAVSLVAIIFCQAASSPTPLNLYSTYDLRESFFKLE